MLFTISRVHNDLARTLMINCPSHTFHPQNDEHLRNRTKFTNEWKSPPSKFLYMLRKRHLYTTHRVQRDFGRQLCCNWYTKSRGKSKSRFA